MLTYMGWNNAFLGGNLFCCRIPHAVGVNRRDIRKEIKMTSIPHVCGGGAEGGRVDTGGFCLVIQAGSF